MVTQHIVLDMTPGTKPIVNVSQYDTGARTLVFHLRQNRQTFTPPEGCTAILHGIKPDSTYFSYAAEIDGDTVIADCTEQMTAVPGFAECEIKITNTEGRVGSCNFRLLVEKSPETGAIISDTDIPVFEQLTDRAEQAASSATSSATAASESAEQAGESATNAGESADRAAREAETASQAAEEAGESAVAAAESASSASGSEASARGFAEQAEQSANDASESAQGAAQGAQTASAKASEAAASADRASGSAVDSATAANLASGYADTARTQAQAAEASATNAAESASTASQAAATATTKAGEASDSATAANTAAGQAASSASAASASAGTASEKATQAGESATNAANSASAAAGSASDASDSAAAALVSERAAAQSASDIAASAAQIQTNTDNIAALQIVESTEAADITSIDDGADGVPMKSLKVYIEPVQDLHGQNAPYPPGGGKNKLKYPFFNTTKTVNGVTFIDNGDGTLSISGTSTSITNFDLAVYNTAVLSEGDYVVSLEGGNSDCYFVYGGGDSGISFGTAYGTSDRAKTIHVTASGVIGYCTVQVRTNATVNLTVKPMIRLASISDSTYAPYSNICPISGWDRVETVRTGKNLLDTSGSIKGGIGADGSVNANPADSRLVSKLLAIKPNTSYYLSNVCPSSAGRSGFWYDASGNGIGLISLGLASAVSGAITSPGNAAFCRIVYFADNEGICMMTAGSAQPSAYEPYEARTITTDLPTTVYGGVLDVISGVLTVDRAMVDLGTLTWATRYTGSAQKALSTTLPHNYKGYPATNFGMVAEVYPYAGYVPGASALSSPDSKSIGIYMYYSTASTVTGVIYAVIGVEDTITGKMVYKLATPTTYTLTPEEVKTLLKANNIFADAGQTAIVYVADPKTYIDNSIADAVASLT